MRKVLILGALALSIACGGSGDSGGGVSNDELALVTPILESPSAEVFEPTGYVDYAEGSLPDHFRQAVDNFENVFDADNTPVDNPLTNAGAALGRVLFYDRNLSLNRKVSCASCHVQDHGFSDPDRFSRGFEGERTGRHSPGLTQGKFYSSGKFFWDERAATLEEQVLLPIENEIEMGLSLPELVLRLEDLPHYSDLFTEAFGTGEVNTDRISKSMAQFVRSMVSYQSKFDSAFGGGLEPDFEGTFTEEELNGLRLFRGERGINGKAIRCDACHTTVAHISRQPENIGLDAVPEDLGAGEGRFKAPSLRNVAVRAPFMHDGRFETLEEVIDHYDGGIQDNPGLNPFLRDAEGNPIRLQLTPEEKSSLVAFLKTLTDESFLSNPLFSNPFSGHQQKSPRDSKHDDRDRDGKKTIPLTSR